MLSFCPFEDIIASWFHISTAHYTVPYHFILKIKQNRIFKINDVGHSFFAFSPPLGRIRKWLEHQPFFLSEASGFHQSKKKITDYKVRDPRPSLQRITGMFIYSCHFLPKPGRLVATTSVSKQVGVILTGFGIWRFLVQGFLHLASFSKTQKISSSLDDTRPMWQSSLCFVIVPVLKETTLSVESTCHFF